MYYGGIDFTYLIFFIPALLLTLWAQAAVNSRFAKFNKVPVKKGVTGAQAAAILLRANGITDVKIAHISGARIGRDYGFAGFGLAVLF